MVVRIPKVKQDAADCLIPRTLPIPADFVIPGDSQLKVSMYVTLRVSVREGGRRSPLWLCGQYSSLVLIELAHIMTG